jgi:hypothetical protein
MGTPAGCSQHQLLGACRAEGGSSGICPAGVGEAPPSGASADVRCDRALPAQEGVASAIRAPQQPPHHPMRVPSAGVTVWCAVWAGPETDGPFIARSGGWALARDALALARAWTMRTRPHAAKDVEAGAQRLSEGHRCDVARRWWIMTAASTSGATGHASCGCRVHGVGHLVELVGQQDRNVVEASPVSHPADRLSRISRMTGRDSMLIRPK